MRPLPSFVLALSLAGCAKNPPATPASQANQAGAQAGGHGAGTFAEPIPRCGPRDSYAYVAREFQCKDGKNPLNGQLEEAARVRLGGRSHPNGHIIDLYQVPCAGGDETVYVDMYGCPDQQARLSPQKPPEMTAAEEAFDQGKFSAAERACIEVLEGDGNATATAQCIAMTPAAMALGGKEEQALRMVGGFCARLTGGAAHKTRIQFVKEVSRWYFRGTKGRISREEFTAVVGRFASACGVNDDQGA